MIICPVWSLIKKLTAWWRRGGAAVAAAVVVRCVLRETTPLYIQRVVVLFGGTNSQPARQEEDLKV